MKILKITRITSAAFAFLLFNTSLLFGQGRAKDKPVQKSARTFPVAINGKVQSYYGHRPDGKPGRAITLYFKGAGFIGKGTVEVNSMGKKEKLLLDAKNQVDSLNLLLPNGAGVKADCEAELTVKSSGKELKATISVPALRQWTVYIYPHSHVDIGYTNTQANVEVIHKRNLKYGIELAKKTANYPKDARYLWNPEVLWPVERFLRTATPAQTKYMVDAVQKGYLHLDASYVNTNTSVESGEEMFEFLGHARKLEKLTGKKIETFVQVDVPGMSWGLVPVAAKQGIKYIFALNNSIGRVGLTTKMSFKPFWWKSQDGQSKVLFLQPGSYNPGANAKGIDLAMKMMGQTDTNKILKIVKTDHPREHFIDKYLAEKLPELAKSDYYPYDIFAMSWAMADNTPIDADLPDAVKSWNEQYAFPHLVIASATRIMQTFEKKYGDKLPVLSGDFTETWTDGLGSAARQTSMNRASKERLVQDETLWSMLHPGQAAPRKELEEAWRNVSMGSEHTWCYSDPSRQPITNDILKVKFGFFQKAEDMSKSLMRSALSAVHQERSSVIGVFNTLSWAHSGLVLISGVDSKDFNGIKDGSGKQVISQRLSTGQLAFLAKDVPAFGSKNYILYRQTKPGHKSVQLVHDNILDNGTLRVVIDPKTGDIRSLVSGRQEFVDTAAACNLNSYRYLHGDDDPSKATGPKDVKISIKENGPLMVSILVSSQAEGCRSLTREVTIIAGQPYIEIKNIIDKQAIQKKEGIHFGFAFNIDNPTTRADIPWGVMQVEADQLYGANRNWIAFQRWLDVSGKGKGVTWCSLDAPVFEVGNITANILDAALDYKKWIKKLEPSGTIYSWALNNHWYTNFPLSQEGKIEYRYRILPHNSAYDAGVSNRFGLEQAQPLIASLVKEKTNCSPMLSVEGGSKVAVSILKADSTGNYTLVRLRSVSDKDQQVKLNWLSRKPASIAIMDQGKAISKGIREAVVVPAMGFITLKAKFVR